LRPGRLGSSIGSPRRTALNLTLVSSQRDLDITANLDPATVTEPQLLRQSLEESYRDLIAIA
jgi:uncharacterized protein DUF1298